MNAQIEITEFWLKDLAEATRVCKRQAIDNANLHGEKFFALSVPTRDERPYSRETPRSLIVSDEQNGPRERGYLFDGAYLCCPSEETLRCILPAIAKDGYATIFRVMGQ